MKQVSFFEAAGAALKIGLKSMKPKQQKQI